MKKTMVILVMLVTFTGCKKTTSLKESVAEESAVKEKVVGVYDSRAVADAYWTIRLLHIEQLQDDYDENGKLMSHPELGMNKKELGILMHQQVFSYHKPVQALEHIADKLPEFMKQNEVEVIVSKWDKEELAKYNVVCSGWDDDFEANNPNVVDLTIKMNQLFDPTATQKMYDELFGRSKPEPFDTDWANVKE
jgi:hypothetical protein